MKIFIILFISTALMLCLNATIQINAQVDLQNFLVAFYPFNGNANDESGNNNNGSVHGAKLTTDRFGNPNSAYNFNGLDNYIVVANSTSLTSIENSNIVSISAWVLIRNWYQGWNIFAIINKYREFDDNGWEFLAGAQPSEGFGFGLELGMSKYYDYQFTFNTWYHLAAVYDKDQDMMNLYLNGQKVFTDTCNSSLKNTQGGPLFIGYSPMGPDEYSDGKIDDIRIYNRELSDTEIQTIYQEKPPDKLLYIKPATNISKSGFTANWYKYPGSKDFKLDFTNDPQFDSLILSNVDVGNDSSYTITGLSLIEGATYYYRMRAITEVDTSSYSFYNKIVILKPPGNALKFCGNGDFVSIPRSIQDDFTIEFWFYSGNGGFSIIDGELDGSDSEFKVSSGGGQILFGTGNPEVDISGSFPLNDGYWHHAAATRTKSTGHLELYIDGTLVATGTGSTNSLTAPRMLLTDNNNWGWFTLDELRLWNIVRTQEQIRSSMYTSLAGTETGLQAYYKFDQGIAGEENSDDTTLIDATANGNNGKLHNFGLHSGNCSNWVSSGACHHAIELKAPTQISTSCFTANWHPVYGSTDFRIDVADNAGFNPMLICNMDAGNDTSFKIQVKLWAGQTYCYRMRVISETDTSPNSAIQSICTPFLKEVTNVSTSGFRVNWYPVQGATDFRIDVTDNWDFNAILISNLDAGTDSSVQIIGFPIWAGLTYQYRMRIIAGTDTSPNSITQYVSLPFLKPATYGVWNGFIANWYPVYGATDFRIDVADNYDFNPMLISNMDAGKDSSFQVTSPLLKPWNSYYYRMRIVAEKDTSPNSSAQWITINFPQQKDSFILNVKQPPIEQCIINGIKKTDINRMKVFPNPSDGNLTLTLDEDQFGSPVIVQVLNLDGAVLLNYLDYADGNNSQLSLDLSKFSKGLYIIQVSGKGITLRDKIIIL
jgi:Concanavalin A-like lectin/glucanases superfamily/Secretion system C-terminal sorting domain